MCFSTKEIYWCWTHKQRVFLVNQKVNSQIGSEILSPLLTATTSQTEQLELFPLTVCFSS